MRYRASRGKNPVYQINVLNGLLNGSHRTFISRLKGQAYQRGTDVGEGSWRNSYTLVLGKWHIGLIVDDDTNTGSIRQITDVLVLVCVEHH